MKTNAPETLYLSKNIYSTYIYQVPDPDDDTAVEYVRKDAFVEKVARFLEYKLNDRVEIQVAGTLIQSLTSKIAFVDEFKKYMEGE